MGKMSDTFVDSVNSRLTWSTLEALELIVNN